VKQYRNGNAAHTIRIGGLKNEEDAYVHGRFVNDSFTCKQQTSHVLPHLWYMYMCTPSVPNTFEADLLLMIVVLNLLVVADAFGCVGCY
jgi:hypothetical protein